LGIEPRGKDEKEGEEEEEEEVKVRSRWSRAWSFLLPTRRGAPKNGEERSRMKVNVAVAALASVEVVVGVVWRAT
jgi:hypothetical protein